MFQVLENGKPCDSKHFSVDASWDKAEYDTFEEAFEYALNWFHPYLGNKHGFVPLNANEPYDYSGYGDIVEIREIQ